MAVEEYVGDQTFENGGGIGQTAGLDHHALEQRQGFVTGSPQQFRQCRRQGSLWAAAQAAAVQHHHGINALLHQQMIETDIAGLVDHHCRIAKLRRRQQAVEQRRLASAEESRQQNERDAVHAPICLCSSRMAAATASSRTLSRLPENTWRSAMIGAPLRAAAMKIVPTGFLALPPPGPA